MSTNIHTGGGAVLDARYCEAGAHSFVSVTADYANIQTAPGGVNVQISGPAVLYISPGNARALAEQILAAVPVKSDAEVAA